MPLAAGSRQGHGWKITIWSFGRSSAARGGPGSGDQDEYRFAPHERPPLPGSPATPDHPALRRVAYFAIGTLLGLTGGFINALLSANLPQIQGALGLTSVPGGWLTAAYSMTNVCMSLLMIKFRQQFGIQRFTRRVLAGFVALNFAQLFVHSYGTELVVRGAGDFAAADGGWRYPEPVPVRSRADDGVPGLRAVAALAAERDNSSVRAARFRDVRAVRAGDGAAVRGAGAGADRMVTNAKAQLARAQADMARVNDLVGEGSISLRERDQPLAAPRQAQAGVLQAQAQRDVAGEAVRTVVVGRGGLSAGMEGAGAALKLAEIDLANTVIRAPQDGRLGEVGVRLEGAGARRDQAAFAYRKTALTAFRETGDALVTIARLGDQRRTLEAQRIAVASALHHAANRFGLGARPGEIRAIAGDPRGWLMAQLSPESAPPAPLAALPSTREAAEAFDAWLKSNGLTAASATGFAQKDRKAGAVGGGVAGGSGSAMGAPGLPAGMSIEQSFIHTLGPGYAAAVHARMEVGVATERPFFERLVRFWGNHFTVSASKPSAFPIVGVRSGYTQADVTSLARIITGWMVRKRDGTERAGGGEGAQASPMFVFRPAAHEPGAQALLGKRYPQDGLAQGEAALADLAAHPVTGQFIATKLVRHFVADDPPPAAVDRVAAVFRQSGGDLHAVSSALDGKPALTGPQLIALLDWMGQRPFYAPVLRARTRRLGR